MTRLRIVKAANGKEIVHECITAYVRDGIVVYKTAGTGPKVERHYVPAPGDYFEIDRTDEAPVGVKTGGRTLGVPPLR